MFREERSQFAAKPISCLHDLLTADDITGLKISKISTEATS